MMKLLVLGFLLLMLVLAAEAQTGPQLPGELCVDQSLDVTFLVDMSTSISPDNYRLMQDFIVKFTAGLDYNLYRVAVAFFADDAGVQFDLTQCSDAACVQALVKSMLQTGGSTNLKAGIEIVMDDIYKSPGDRLNVPHMVIVMTDGVPTTPPTPADKTKFHGIAQRVVVLAIGADADNRAVYEIATQPFSANVLFVDKFSQLANPLQLTTLSQLFCYDVAVTGVTLPIAPSTCQLDIGLLVDLSASITNSGAIMNNWIQLRQFLLRFVEEIKTKYSDVYIAFMYFRTSPQLVWNFRDCDRNRNLKCMTDRIWAIDAPQNTPRMSTAFNEMRKSIWGTTSSSNRPTGNRPNVDDLTIFLTDGFPFPNVNDPRNEARKMRERDAIRIFGIGVGSDVNEQTMRGVVSSPYEQNFLNVTDFTFIVNQVETLIARACESESTLPCDTSDVIFLLDASSSMNGDDFDVMKKFTIEIIRSLPVDNSKVRVGVAQYETRVKTVFDLNKYTTARAMWREIIKMAHTGGKTNTHFALRHINRNMLIRSRGDRPTNPNIVVVFIDDDTQFKQETIEAAVELQKKAHVIVMQIGTFFDVKVLSAIASYPSSENLIVAENFTVLSTSGQVKAKLQERICNNNSTCLGTTVCLNGGTPIEGFGSCSCNCAIGFRGPNCGSRCAEAADICLVVDTSSSISDGDFRELIRFIKNFTNHMNFDQQRICLVSWATEEKVHLTLGEIREKQAALNAMELHHSGGSTSTWLALRATQRVFQRAGTRTFNGKRVPKIAIVITDGGSSKPADTFTAAVNLKAGGVSVIAIRIGRPNIYEMEELRGITSPPTDVNFLELGRYSQLNTVINNIFGLICNDSCAGVACQNGGTPGKQVGQCVCVCPTGFTGDRCEKACSDRIDIALLLDVSGSIRIERYPFVLDFLSSVISQIRVGRNNAHIGLISYSTRANIDFGLEEYSTTSDVVNALRRIPFSGLRTDIYGALNLARRSMFGRRGDRRNAPNYILMFTDGGANVNEIRTSEPAKSLRKDGVHIIIMAVGSDMEPRMLRTIASYPYEETIFWTPSQTGLLNLVNKASLSICNNVNECESSPCQNGATCVDDLHIYWCRCPRNFQGRLCEIPCAKRLDVVFVLDFSGSVHHVYDVILVFAKRAIEIYNIDTGDVRVGVVSYSDRANIQFDLDDYARKKKDAINALTVDRLAGLTNTWSGLSEAHNRLFQSSRGDRRGVDNVLVLVSDGQSNVRSRDTVREAERAKNKGIKIITVAVGSVDRSEMNAIATDPQPHPSYSNYTISLEKLPDMDGALEQLVYLSCDD